MCYLAHYFVTLFIIVLPSLLFCYLVYYHDPGMPFHSSCCCYSVCLQGWGLLPVGRLCVALQHHLHYINSIFNNKDILSTQRIYYRAFAKMYMWYFPCYSRSKKQICKCILLLKTEIQMKIWIQNLFCVIVCGGDIRKTKWGFWSKQMKISWLLCYLNYVRTIS